MLYFSAGCIYLEELNISWCQNITDKGIRLIAEGCPYLKSLICKGCEGLTANCFSDLNPGNVKELRVLNLLSCSVSWFFKYQEIEKSFFRTLLMKQLKIFAVLVMSWNTCAFQTVVKLLIVRWSLLHRDALT